MRLNSVANTIRFEGKAVTAEHCSGTLCHSPLLEYLMEEVHSYTAEQKCSSLELFDCTPK